MVNTYRSLSAFVAVCIVCLSAHGQGPGSTTRLNIPKEVAALNFLTKYLCILEDLGGRGVSIVRRELTDNVNLSGLSAKSGTLFTGLIEACTEAENALKDVRYVTEDGREKTGEALANETGAADGKSVAMGDPMPLIFGAVRTLRSTRQSNKEKHPELAAAVRIFRERLLELQSEVNVRRAVLAAEHQIGRSRFLTKQLYTTFRDALLDRDIKRRKAALSSVVEACPGFREAHYVLSDCHYEMKDAAGAERILKALCTRESLTVRRDAFLGNVYDDLCYFAAARKAFREAVRLGTKSIQHAPARANAYENRAVAYMHLDEGTKALEDANRARELQPHRAWTCWVSCKIAAKCFRDREAALDHLAEATKRGFNRFELVSKFASLSDALKTNRARYIMTPQLWGGYVPGYFNDDIVIENRGTYALQNVRLTLTVRYRKGEEEKVARGKQEYAQIAAGQKVTFVDFFSMPQSSRCRIELVFTSTQNPAAVTRTTVYNYLDKKLVRTYSSHLNNIAWDVVKSKDEAKYGDALEWSWKSLELCRFQNPTFIDTYAHLLYLSKNVAKAIKWQKQAIHLTKTCYPKYKKQLSHYEDALRMFLQEGIP